jgi:hypothetical protein
MPSYNPYFFRGHGAVRFMGGSKSNYSTLAQSGSLCVSIPNGQLPYTAGMPLEIPPWGALKKIPVRRTRETLR